MKKTVYFLLICITGILFSCKEDEGVLNPHSHEKSHHGYKRSIVSFQDMKAKLENSSGLSVALFNNVSSRGGDNYIQEIDTTYIIEYSNDTLTTYTMKVITLDEENYSYSNLIVKTLNGETEELIVHYTPTAEWQAAHDMGDYLPYDGELEVTDIYGESLGEDPNVQGRGKATCAFSIEANHTPCTGDTRCPCTDYNGITTYTLEINCFQGSGGGNGGSDGGGGPFNENGEGNLPTDPYHGGGGGSHDTSDFNSYFLNNLNTSQANWLLADENTLILQRLYTYLHPTYFDEEIEFAQLIIKFLMANPQAVQPHNIIQRIEALEQYLYDNPYAISNIPCEQIPQWQDVAQHQVPTAVKNKLEQLNQNNSAYNYDWAIQSIENAGGSLVNNDYFAVTFNTMPYKPFPNQNQQFTPEEFLRYVRTNINNFVNTSLSNFSPSTITGYNETAIWNSNNPVEAIMHIDITGNDGSVITTGHQVNYNGFGGFNNGHWIFTTIQTPWYDVFPGGDGPHPVSGHRKFGLKINAGGSYTLYTRGVDRIQNGLDAYILGGEENVFDEADQLWESFQQGLKDYIQSNSYGNTVTVNTPVKWRPDWAEVKDVLINNKPLSNLGCN